MRAARTTSRLALASLTVLALAGAGACGGDDDDGGEADVASLDDGSDDATDGTTEGTAAEDAPEDVEEAVLAFAECMREHGVEMPDPSVNEGRVAIAISGDNGVSEAEMEEAQKACEPLMANARGGEMQRDPEREAEMQQQMLEFAECMREHGIDMPDPEFGSDGRVTIRGTSDARFARHRR
jgi:hypothetical protein